MRETTKSRVKALLRLVLFVALSAAASTPLRIFVEAVIEGKEGAPEFVTVGFLIYGFCAKLVVGAGYLLLGQRLPVKNNVLRGFCYITLILISSYLPNVLGMAGGDGEIIGESLSAGIVVVDTLSYLFDGLILGLLMRKYDAPGRRERPSVGGFWAKSALIGAAFAGLNLLADLAAGAVDSGWRLDSILGVSAQSEGRFYLVFAGFMFIAGALLPLWFRYCMPEGGGLRRAALFGAELCAAVWLPNVLIMAFFGTPALLTCAYGAAYTVLFAGCGMIYQKLERANQTQPAAIA